MSQTDVAVVPISKESARDASSAPDTFLQKVCQQRLAGTSILFTAKWAIVLFTVFVVLFLAFGIVLWEAAKDIEEHTQQYGDQNESTEDLSVNEEAKWNMKVDVVTIKVDQRTMEAPIWVQYKLELFYQNHRRYRKSVSWSQLSNPDLAPPTDADDTRYASECDFWRREQMAPKRVWYPCGLVARSVFSDHFLIYKKESNAATWSEVDVLEDRDDVIDKALNVDTLFKNIKDKTSDKLNYWIYAQFPPETCLPSITDVDQAETNKDGIKALYVSYTDAGQPDCDYAAKTCNFSQGLKAKTSENNPVVQTCAAWKSWADRQTGLHYTYRSKKPKQYGVESSHFITWFYLASYPNFRKNWGKITTDIPKGTQLKVFILDNFDVNSFGGKKYFSVTTDNWLGTSNSGLAIAYFTTAGCCLVATAYLVYVWMKRPRNAEAIRLDFVRQQ
eukprot:GEMP01010881.1.p1 GENE.GEMP01010881.1~~GEMP01010881.1.p1  ORF type:complete len:445 (-),score=77.29 GEMP01010881.1:467-1801(-)